MTRFPVSAGALAALLLSACAEPTPPPPEPGIGTCDFGSPLPAPWEWDRDFYDKPSVKAEIAAFGVPAEDIGKRPPAHNRVYGAVYTGKASPWPPVDIIDARIADGGLVPVNDGDPAFAGMAVYRISGPDGGGRNAFAPSRETFVKCVGGGDSSSAVVCQMTWQIEDGRHADVFVPRRALGQMPRIKASLKALSDACLTSPVAGSSKP